MHAGDQNNCDIASISKSAVVPIRNHMQKLAIQYSMQLAIILVSYNDYATESR